MKASNVLDFFVTGEALYCGLELTLKSATNDRFIERLCFCHACSAALKSSR